MCPTKIIVKIFRLFVRILINLLKMCTNSEAPEKYKFCPFIYEEIVPKDGKVPSARSGHRIAANSANFYSFGGYNPLITQNDDESDREQSYPLFQELWSFNFSSKMWFRYPNSETLPVELASNAMLLQGNLLMVYGGTGSPFGYRCSNQLYICNVIEDNGEMTEIKATGKFPLQLYGQALVYHNNYIYTIGGTTGLSYTCDIHSLNLETFEWSDVYVSKGLMNNEEPEGRYRHEVAFDGENIFILGGGTADLVYGFEILPCFNIKKKEWRNVRAMKDDNYGFPAPRRCHGAVQINVDDRIQAFVTGGQDGDHIFGDIWRLDLATFKWTCFSQCTLPREMYFHATAATPEGRLYVFGGIFIEDENFSRTNCIYSTWLCIPKLSEMCWEALLTYYPGLVSYDKDLLIDAGLPKKFVKRLPL